MNDPIIVEHYFDVPRETVWKSITQHDLMVQWYFDNIESFEPRVGFETSFTVQVEDRIFPHHWKITEVLPERKISYDWRYPNYPGEANVSFDILEENGQTKLTLTCQGIESFPQDIPEFNPESCRAGWNYFIKGNLKDFLDKK